jgi:hypothetical protein
MASKEACVAPRSTSAKSNFERRGAEFGMGQNLTH